MSNPFDEVSGHFVVLMNKEGQYSLWPAWIDIPAGWNVQYGEDSKINCLEYINTHWKDLAPRHLQKVKEISYEN
ncbi:MbtH family protein [Hazenella sp. IB182357]|uniref:MbtH family protein n=1 Tax=Polycladospora coralii TaxID=2771432 RepID=A0A926RSZ6_9BACL|nr:MbtH family protein [Polycladospora coralii]MBD1371008.1 MbtH family protein [Polycladospora coralii]MBS7529947.1 MbtH family protein [Polycladospora coralii]